MPWSNRWGNNGNSDGLNFGGKIWGGSKITVDGDCSHEIKKCLLLRRKVMTKLDSILKSRDTTLPTKVHLVKAMVFPVVMYGCERWTIKKTACWRIDASELCGAGEGSWESLGQQGDPTSQYERKSVLNIHWKDWYWSWNSNILATWWEKLTHLKRPWCWERLKAGGKGDDRGWDDWMASLTLWTWVWVTSESCDGQGGLVCFSTWGCKESDTTEWLNWTDPRTREN